MLLLGFALLQMMELQMSYSKHAAVLTCLDANKQSDFGGSFEESGFRFDRL